MNLSLVYLVRPFKFMEYFYLEKQVQSFSELLLTKT